MTHDSNKQVELNILGEDGEDISPSLKPEYVAIGIALIGGILLSK